MGVLNLVLKRARWRSLGLVVVLGMLCIACYEAPKEPTRRARVTPKPPLKKPPLAKPPLKKPPLAKPPLKKPPLAGRNKKPPKAPRVATGKGGKKPPKVTPNTKRPKARPSTGAKRPPSSSRRGSKTLVSGKGRDGLLDLLDEAAVLVLARDPRSGEGGMGTGFFVTSDIVVTNSHVVDFARSPIIHVTGVGLGKVRQATLIHKTGSDEGSAGADYALLRVPGFKAKKTLTLTARVDRLSKVIAAGFPGVVTQSDENFDDLMRGKERSIPEVVTTEGTVNSVQEQSRGVPLVIHDATIEQGNSGGPLIDLCGRVIAINTWKIIRNAQQDTSQFAKSIAAKHLITYLKRHNVKARFSKRKCKADS